ncbi:hypothetical protein CEXT_113321 [Caerostris extrusa]|uniref:Uncharacterized protein n=1 Tax=Caerostris extrusa TaxID=172846 RepID=A0AAV4MBI2_CAEEX|nr:hypothetical protein CEXT_113321 [Caerostris extrusa]
MMHNIINDIIIFILVSTFTDSQVVVHFSPFSGKEDSKSYIDGLISMFLKILDDDIASFLPQLHEATKFKYRKSTERNHHPKHVSNLGQCQVGLTLLKKKFDI